MIGRALNKREWVVLAFLMLTVFIVRMKAQQFYPFNEDESGSIVAMKNIVATGAPLLENGQLYWRSMLGHYLMAIPLFFMDISKVSTRLTCLLLSVAIFPFILILAYRSNCKYTGWLTILFLSISSFQNYLASFARFYQPFQFFFLVSVWLIGEVYVNGRKNLQVWMLLAVLATIATHKLSIELFFVFAAAWCVGHLPETKKLSFWAGVLAVGLTAYALLFWYPEASYRSSLSLPLAVGGLKDKLSFFRQFGQLMPAGLVLLALAIAALVQQSNRFLAFVLLSFLGPLLFFSMVAPDGNVRYLANLFPLGVFVCCFSAAYWVEKVVGLRGNWKDFKYRTLFMLLVSFSVIFVQPWNAKIAVGHQIKNPDQEPAHRFILENMGKEDLLISFDPSLSWLLLQRKPDYFLRQKYDENLGGFRIWSSDERSATLYPLIDTHEQLLTLLNMDRVSVWLYANYKMNFTIDSTMKTLINKKMKIVYQDDKSVVFIRR